MRGEARNRYLGAKQVLQSKPWSRGRSARYSRARSARELKARSVWELRAKPEEKAGGGVWGGGSVSTLPRKFLKNQTWNHSFWCIFEGNYLKLLITCMVRDHCSIVPLSWKIDHWVIDFRKLFILMTFKTSKGDLGHSLLWPKKCWP